jgi:hypothetical protein
VVQEEVLLLNQKTLRLIVAVLELLTKVLQVVVLLQAMLVVVLAEVVHLLLVEMDQQAVQVMVVMV